MDTTKNSREEQSRRPRQETPQNPRPKNTGEPPRKKPGTQAEAAPAATKRPQQAQAKPRTGEGRTAVQDRPHPKKEKPQAASSRRTEAPQRPKQGKGKPKSRKPVIRLTFPKRREQEPVDDLSSKKRAYGNSKPKKKSSVAVMGEALVATAQESAARRKQRQAASGKRPKRPQQPTPAVIYTQPQVFNRNRLLIQLVTVTAVVVAFVVGISVFFKVGTITVSGAEVYTEWAIKEASGISEGDNLLTFSRARAGALIKANLPYVKNVSFGIKLPDTVNIIIEEEDVVYAIRDQDGQWWLMTSEGRIVEQTNDAGAANYTQILGVALNHPLKNQIAVAVEATPQETQPEEGADGEPQAALPAMVTGAQRLDAAMKILRALEANDIVGSAASINVAQTQSITLWYGTRYQVNLGDTTNLDQKVAIMNDVILQMSDYQSGILDVSFTIWPDQVGYTPFA